MRPNWPKLASLAQKISSLVHYLLPKETLLTFKNIFKRQDLVKPSLVAFKFQTMLCKKDLYSYNIKNTYCCATKYCLILVSFATRTKLRSGIKEKKTFYT